MISKQEYASLQPEHVIRTKYKGVREYCIVVTNDSYIECTSLYDLNTHFTFVSKEILEIVNPTNLERIFLTKYDNL